MLRKPVKHEEKMSAGLKWSIIGGGTVAGIGIVIAILNTYTDVFEDVFTPKPKPVAINYMEPDEVSDETPAKKLSDEVRNAYNQVDRVRAEVTMGSTCTVQMHVSQGVLAQWTSSKQIVEGVLSDVRQRARKHSRSRSCVVDVVSGGDIKVRARPKGEGTRFEYY